MLAKRCTRLTTASSVELPEVAERDLPLIDIDALLQRQHGSEGFDGARGGSEDSAPAVTFGGGRLVSGSGPKNKYL